MPGSGDAGTGKPRVVPRIRRRSSGVRNLFAGAGLVVALATWALFHFVYDLGGPAVMIAALAGGGVFLVSEAVFAVTAALLGWPHETRISVRDALEGLLSRSFW